MIDWKTSRKKKSALADCYDYPLQLVAYSGAINHNPNMFDFKVSSYGDVGRVGGGEWVCNEVASCFSYLVCDY